MLSSGLLLPGFRLVSVSDDLGLARDELVLEDEAGVRFVNLSLESEDLDLELGDGPCLVAGEVSVDFALEVLADIRDELLRVRAHGKFEL